MIFELYYTRL